MFSRRRYPTNLASGTVTLAADVSAGNVGSGVGLIANAGLIRKTGTAVITTFPTALINRGTLEVLTGTLWMTGPYNMTAGALGFGISSSTNCGQLSVSGSAPLIGSLRATLLNGCKPATKLKKKRSKFSIWHQSRDYGPQHPVAKSARTTGAEDKARTFKPWSQVVNLA